MLEDGCHNLCSRMSKSALVVMKLKPKCFKNIFKRYIVEIVESREI